MSYLTKYEKETIILWNQTDEPASIQTYDRSIKKRLEAFAKKHPDLCVLERENELGGVFYRVEKARVSVRFLSPYSEERKKKASEQAKKTGLNAKQE